MRAVLSGAWRAALVGGLAVGGCMAQVPPATPEVTAQPGDATTSNHPVALTITCAELRALFKAGDNRTAGAAILWLDGYYAGRSGLSELPAGWGEDRGPGRRWNLRDQRQRTAHRSRCHRPAPSGIREPTAGEGDQA
jgi:hypothetical protein